MNLNNLARAQTPPAVQAADSQSSAPDKRIDLKSNAKESGKILAEAVLPDLTVKTAQAFVQATRAPNDTRFQAVAGAALAATAGALTGLVFDVAQLVVGPPLAVATLFKRS